MQNIPDRIRKLEEEAQRRAEKNNPPEPGITYFEDPPGQPATPEDKAKKERGERLQAQGRDVTVICYRKVDGRTPGGTE